MFSFQYEKMRDDKVPPISGPFVSAKHFREFLVDRFDFQESNIEIINNVNQITQDKVVILNKMCELTKKIKKGDTVVLFLSRHGVRRVEDRCNNSTKFIEGFVDGPYESHGYTRVTDHDINEIFGDLSDEICFLFTGDCCNSGGLLGGAQEAGGVSNLLRVTDKQMAPKALKKRRIRVYLSACQTGHITTSTQVGLKISLVQLRQSCTCILSKRNTYERF